MNTYFIMLAKFNKIHNEKLLGYLSKLSEEQLNAPNPLLPGGSISGALASMIFNATFTQRTVQEAGLMFSDHSAPYVKPPEDKSNPPSYKGASFAELSKALNTLSRGYVDTFSTCTAEVLKKGSPVPKYDMMSKGLFMAMYTRGQVLYELSKMGIADMETIFKGPLVDDGSMKLP